MDSPCQDSPCFDSPVVLNISTCWLTSGVSQVSTAPARWLVDRLRSACAAAHPTWPSAAPADSASLPHPLRSAAAASTSCTALSCYRIYRCSVVSQPLGDHVIVALLECPIMAWPLFCSSPTLRSAAVGNSSDSRKKAASIWAKSCAHYDCAVLASASSQTSADPNLFKFVLYI